MGLRKDRARIIRSGSIIDTSIKIKRKLISNLLYLIRRNKLDKKKEGKDNRDNQDIAHLKESVQNLKERFSSLENHLKLLLNENNVVCETNRELCNEIMKTRKNAEGKSEKLMLFIMTFMHKIKNNYKFNVTNEEGRIYNEDEIAMFKVNLDYAKKELDNYFNKLETRFNEEGSLVEMMEHYKECKRETNPTIGLKNKTIVHDKNKPEKVKDDFCVPKKCKEDVGFRKIKNKEA